MLTQTLTLPEDPEELRSFTARLLAEVKAQAILIEKLRHQLAGHRAHRFGASSETAEQLQLALETSEIAAAAMTARMKLPDVEEKDKPKRRPVPDHIPRMEVELTPGADACADCGGRLRRIGEDVTEELEYVPGRFIVNRIVRPRLTCACCERFVQAPLPSRPIERGRPGPGLLAHVLVSKFADHLPLYRQSQIFEREGLDLDRSTLADWVGKSTALLEPLADAIGRHVLSAEAIFADDTPISMLAPGTGKTQTARLWTYARDERPWGGDAAPAAWYRFSGDRKGQHPKDHLARFRGWMHADGYAGFEDLYRSGAIREVACMAHVRRKFVDIHRSQGSPSRLCADIDERVNAFLSRPLEGAWPYLWLDATYLKVREGGRIIGRAVIIAVAVNEDGKREVLGVATGPSEAETFWTDFLRSLADRGLRGVKLVIADDHKGLRAAARRVFNATQQRCRVHWMRNALAHAPAKQRTAVAAMLKTIFAQESKADAQTQWDTVADALREKQDKLGAFMDASRDDVLAYMDFPREHWVQIASTNPLERVNREIKRRADVIGIFPNDGAIIRLVGALMLETNDEWTVARRYMSLETLARVTDNPTVRLSAVAT